MTRNNYIPLYLYQSSQSSSFRTWSSAEGNTSTSCLDARPEQIEHPGLLESVPAWFGCRTLLGLWSIHVHSHFDAVWLSFAARKQTCTLPGPRDDPSVWLRSQTLLDLLLVDSDHRREG